MMNPYDPSRVDIDRRPRGQLLGELSKVAAAVMLLAMIHFALTLRCSPQLLKGDAPAGWESASPTASEAFVGWLFSLPVGFFVMPADLTFAAINSLVVGVMLYVSLQVLGDVASAVVGPLEAQRRLRALMTSASHESARRRAASGASFVRFIASPSTRLRVRKMQVVILSCQHQKSVSTLPDRECSARVDAMKAVLGVLTALVVAGALYAADRPNILMIAVDDLRPMLGCYGDARMQTPNIDRIARQGIVFERAYCQYAKCGTSRLSLMTGLRPDAIGVFSNRDQDVRAFRQRNPAAISLAGWLKQQGYETRSFGKIDHDGWDLASDWSVPPFPGRPREMWEIVDERDPAGVTRIAERLACPVMQSVDVPDDQLFAGRMTRRVIEAMRRTSKRPLFLAVGYRRPHLPLIAPRRYFDMYQVDAEWLAANPAPANRSPVMAWFNSDGYVGSARRLGLRMPNPPNAEQAVAWNGYELRSYLGVPNQGPIAPDLQKKLLQAYAACVSYVDAQIGLLLDELTRSRQLENMLVILWSDHGWHLGEQSAWTKMTNFEVATRVPLIIAGPGIEPGRTRAVAELVDLYPTICELTGVPPPDHLQGQSLVPALHEPGESRGWTATSQQTRFQEKYMGRALRTDRFRYVQWQEQQSGQLVHAELYDHRTDPQETNNVAGQPQYAQHQRRLEVQFRDAYGTDRKESE